MHKAPFKENPRLVRAVGDGCFPLPEHSAMSRGVSPLTDFKEARFSRNLGGTAELFVPAFARRNGFFFFHSATINEIIKIIPI